MKSQEIVVESYPIEKLVPYQRNPRKNDRAVGRMVASIQEYGFKIPILARSNGEVVDGHLRLKAAQKLGMSELPVVLCDEWSEAQVKAFRLMVNRSATWAEWDLELLALEMKDLQALDFDLDLTGFEPVEIDDFLLGDDVVPAEEEIPAPCAETVTQLGDRWGCGPHRVLCGDATSEAEVGVLLAGVVPGLMVTDTPVRWVVHRAQLVTRFLDWLAEQKVIPVNPFAERSPAQILEPFSFSPFLALRAGSGQDVP